MSSEKLEKYKKEFAAADQRMLQAEHDLDKLYEFMETYEVMMENLKQLSDFYFKGDWNLKREMLEEAGMANFGSASEDGIWNLVTEFQGEKIRLLKLLTDDIYRDTFEK